MCLMFLVSAPWSGHAAGKPFCVVPRVATPPALAAEAANPAWARGARIRIDQAAGETAPAPVSLATDVTLLRTDDALYLRFACPNPAAPKLKTRVRGRDEEAYTDESVELFLDRRDGSDYFQLVINASGSVYDGRKFNASWNGDWTAETRLVPGGWTAAVRIPFDTLGGPPADGSYWLLSLCRNAHHADGRSEASAWIAPGYHQPMGLLCFGGIDARPLFGQLHAGVAQLRRFEEAGNPGKVAPGKRIAASAAALEAQCPDLSRVAPERFAALLADAEDLSRATEPHIHEALMRAILGDRPTGQGDPSAEHREEPVR